jgi:DNA replicative helicase MCM subunit Mcm2 (Cdc46/Mcm family)
MSCSFGSIFAGLIAPLQNIDFQTTILSRFDMIFIVKDEHNETRDKVSLIRNIEAPSPTTFFR